MPAKVDALGLRFGRLVVIAEAGSGPGGVRWFCQCDCGNQIIATGCHLRQLTKSCGCWKREYVRRIQPLGAVGATRHGHARRGKMTPTYNSWMAMRARCLDPKVKAFKNYGGRGITICQQWLDRFENFLADMGERPEGLSLDRIDNAGNYEPGNCRWATRTEQNVNQRSHGRQKIG
jgi:hypothetical protein